jgi:23S rRNA (adenine2503-C2)-methyltransferase
MTNLPKGLRATLADRGLGEPLQILDCHESADGARKLVAELTDGARIETVLLPHGAPAAAEDADVAAAVEDDALGLSGPHGRGEERSRRTRVTQCVSTQVGCAMGCVLCASGQAGLRRHLGAEEILGQVLAGRRALEPDEALHNVLFMGIGEPLHNYEATARTVRLLTHPDGLGLSPRRLTLSTCGLTPKVERLAEDFDARVGLAVSIHGPDDDTRAALCPIGRRHPLAELAGALRRYAQRGRRPITVEYTLVAERNDGRGAAAKLARLLAGMPVKVNLIPLNPIAGSELAPPPPDRILSFQRELVDAGILCFIRRRRGDDVSAACGQLALQSP